MKVIYKVITKDHKSLKTRKVKTYTLDWFYEVETVTLKQLIDRINEVKKNGWHIGKQEGTPFDYTVFYW